MNFLQRMTRIADPAARLRFLELLGLRELRRV